MVILKTLQTPFSKARKAPERTALEETYKSLQAIYALEDVDVKSIRKISDPRPMARELIQDAPEKAEPAPLPKDYELDLGPAYRGSMEHFVLKEPIQVLNLSKHAEKCLIDQEKQLIRDLINANFSNLIFIKGMGQGHIDEIQHKLNRYLEGKVLYHSKTVDFACWIRSLLSDLDRRKGHIVLEPFGLANLCPLTQAESVEVRRLTLEKRIEWREEAADQFATLSRKKRAHQEMSLLVDVFIKPWVKKRQGLASQEEIQERLQVISDNPKITPNALEFFKCYFFDAFPPSEFLPSLGQRLYAADPIVENAYHQVVKIAESYFYNPLLQYPLEQLTSLIERECSRRWIGFGEGFVEKTLRHSPAFRVRRDFSGNLRVRHA